MYPARISSKQAASQLSKIATSSARYSARTATARGNVGRCCVTGQQCQSRQSFSSTPASRLRDYFPAPENAPHIRKTDAAWPHPVYVEHALSCSSMLIYASYTEQQMRENIVVAHRQTSNWSDWVALAMVRILRWGTDTATGYRHDVEVPTVPGDTNAVAKTKPYKMSERKWLIRFVFLESVAGVPGMVAGMLRHLHSLRRMKRDNGWYVSHIIEMINPSHRAKLMPLITGSRLCWKKHITSACISSHFSRWPNLGSSCVL